MSARFAVACVLCAAVLSPIASVAQGAQSSRKPTVEEDLAAIAAFAVSLGLVIYDSWFLRKTRMFR